MGNALFYAGISWPLQPPESELCKGISEKKLDLFCTLFEIENLEIMRDYFLMLEELKKADINALEGDFYNYTDLPLEKEFAAFYTYCQEYLDRDDLGFDIKPARFYYNTNTDVNGLAYAKNGYYLVEIYKGAIFGLHTFFNDKKDRFNEGLLKPYKELVEIDGISSQYFLFQFVTLYFLYHEVGHLIQRCSGAADQKEFMDLECEGTAITIQHVKEHDADWFAVNQIAFHIKAFVEKITAKLDAINNYVVEDVASLALAGIYMYFIRRAKGHAEIYYNEKCHPHPSVRLSYTVIYLLDALSVNLSVPINKRFVLTNAIRISEALMMEPERNIIEEYSMQLNEEISKVEAYINEIRGNSENYPHTAINALTSKQSK